MSDSLGYMNKPLRASAIGKQPKILKAASLLQSQSQTRNTPSPLIFRSKSPTQEFSLNYQKSPKNSTASSSDNSNKVYQFTKKELENKLKVFIQAYSQKKLVAGSIVSPRNAFALDDLEQIFFKQLPEQKAVNKSCDLGVQRPRKKIPKQVAAESFVLNQPYDPDFVMPVQKNKENVVDNTKEYEYIKKIKELEDNRRIYEEKINKHAVYTTELEQKVDLLIKEYENVVVQNEKLKLKMEDKENLDASILNTSVDSLEKLAEKARLEELRMSNEDLQQTIQTLESKLHGAEEQNQKLTKEVQRTQHRLEEALALAEESEQNAHFIKELKQENHSLKSQICEKTRIIEDLQEKPQQQPQQNSLDELQKCISEYCTQISNLNTELVSSQEKSHNLQSQITCLQHTIKDLEQKAHQLTQDNTRLQKQHENNLVVISSLQNQIDEQSFQARSLSLEDLRVANGKEELETTIPVPSEIDVHMESQDILLSKTLEAKEQELQEERTKYKWQIEQYNTNLDMLVNKIQILVKINENLAKDVEFERYDFNNYRASVWSVYQEAKRCLEIVKKSDTELESYFKTGNDDLQKDFDTLLTTYYAIRKEAMKIDTMIEERKLYL